MDRRIVLFMLLFFAAGMAVAQTTDTNGANREQDPTIPPNCIKIPGKDLYVSYSDESSRMNYGLAKSVCESKGKGWRLPTVGELLIVYQYKEMLGNFKPEYYWAVSQNPENGRFFNIKFTNGKVADENFGEKNSVRCVWCPDSKY